jgi:uncharacterized protein
LVEWLMAKGANVNVNCCGGDTPLDIAISIGLKTQSYELFQFLLDHGADPEFRGFNTQTALHTACVWGAMPAIETLLARGANVNARSLIDGAWTPLMAAAAAGRADIVELLLRHGARTDFVCQFTGMTAEELARKNGATNVLSELENWSARPE